MLYGYAAQGCFQNPFHQEFFFLFQKLDPSLSKLTFIGIQGNSLCLECLKYIIVFLLNFFK